MIYVGRGSEWGNPFRLKKGEARGAASKRYRSWLWLRIKSGEVSLDSLRRLHGKELRCPGCAPGLATCHARVLEAAAEWAVSSDKE